MVFIPLCLSVGGNAGSQAATLVIRRTRPRTDHASRDWFRVFRRELLMAAALAADARRFSSIARTYFLTPDNILAEVPDGTVLEPELGRHVLGDGHLSDAGR